VNDILGRLERGDKIAAGGAALLLISLFLPWFDIKTGSSVIDQAIDQFGGSLTAFKVFDFLDVLLFVIAAGVVVGLILIARGMLDSGLRRAVESVGGIATLAVLWGMFDNARHELIGLRYGAFLGLIGAVAIAVGGYMNRRDGVV
jgi:hypothetical protein